ncbi:MAG: aspartyl protease family protein [Gammaproteobacteria bacterium]
MRSTSIFTAIVLFAAGCATGWWAANWSKPESAPAATTTQIEPDFVVSAPEADKRANTVWLTVEFEGGSSLVPAVRLRDTGLLLASLYNVYPANSAHYQNADGEKVFVSVVAADHAHNLIAFVDNYDSGFDISTEDGSLFIGKDVELDLPGLALPGQIESALQTAPGGQEYFRINFGRSESQKGGPLLAPRSQRLIGFVTTSRIKTPGWMHLSGSTYSAIDATTIRAFLASDLFDSPQSVRDFTARYASSAGGLRYSISRFAERYQWDAAYKALETLTTLDSDNSDITQQALTLAAYYYGHQLVTSNSSTMAISTMSDMRQRFPQQQPWCLVESRAYAQLAQWDKAFERAHECALDPYGAKPRDSELLASAFRDTLSQVDTEEGLRIQAHSAAIEFAADANASRQRRMQVLLDALELGEHPRLYRLLGDFEYGAKNYVAAQNYYRAAIRLDPSMSAQLGNRLRNSSQRANSAPASEVQFEQRGGGMVVSATLNNSAQSFRFLVDTGATYSALSGGTLIRLGLGNIFNNATDLIELEAAGGTIYARRFTLDSMQIGNARVTQVPVVILENLEGFDGLVGLSFLRHFDVSIDQDANKLILVQQ